MLTHTQDSRLSHVSKYTIAIQGKTTDYLNTKVEVQAMVEMQNSRPVTEVCRMGQEAEISLKQGYEAGFVNA